MILCDHEEVSVYKLIHTFESFFQNKEVIVSRFQEKEKMGEMITKKITKYDNTNSNKKDNI